MLTKTQTRKNVARPMRRGRASRVGASANPFVYLVSMRGTSLPALRDGGAGVCYRVTSKRELNERFHGAPDPSVWIASSASALASLATQAPSHTSDKRLLILDAASGVTHPLYSAYFRHVVAASEDLTLLAFDELTDVLVAPNRSDLFIGGAFDVAAQAVLLYRGNVEPLVVPVRWFANASSAARIDPSNLRVIDHGQTVRLGEFEASADAILYEFDAEYRRAAKKRAVNEDSSLGASIRRLRLQRGLSRDDFPGLSAKSIARVERNEVGRPRVRTLESIAKVLGVRAKSLISY